MILLISSVFPPEPVVSASIGYDLAMALSEKWEVKVITPKPTRPMGFAFNKGIIKNRKFEQIVLDSFTYPKSRLIGRMRESYSFGKHAVSYIKKNRSNIDLIFIHAWPLLAQCLIAKASVRYSIPYVIHIVDIYPEALLSKLPFLGRLFFRWLLQIDKYILKNSSKVVTISNGMKNLLVKTRDLEEANVEVVSNWQDEELYIKSRNPKSKDGKSSKFTFMFLGSLSRTASIRTLISAFKTSNIENSRLIIAGNGSEKESLISLAYNLQGNNIEFWDAPLKDVPEIQSKADVFLLSLKIGAAKIALPSKLPSYMFSRKPIIACVEEESDTADAIKKANCGWIITPEQIETLAETMRKVASIPQTELLCYGMNGFNYALENYSKKNNLQKMVSVINEIIDAK